MYCRIGVPVEGTRPLRRHPRAPETGGRRQVSGPGRTGAGLAKPGRVCAYPCRFGQTARGLRIPRRGTIIPRRGTDKTRGDSRRPGSGAADSRRVTAVSGRVIDVSRGGRAVLRAKLAGPRRGAMETARGLRVPRRGTAKAERRNKVPRHGTMTPRAGLDGGGGGAAGPRHGTDVPPDRKSVVEGKSVDRSGRGMRKNKTTSST